MRKKASIRNAVDAAKLNWHIINTLVKIKLPRMVSIQSAKIAEIIKLKWTKNNNSWLDVIVNIKEELLWQMTNFIVKNVIEP